MLMNNSDGYIIVGSGRLAFQCAVSVRKKGKDVVVLEYKIADVSVLEKMCRSKGIFYSCLNKTEMTEYLSHIKTPTVVFSVMNTYLFPAKVINNKFLEIINAHNSILPKHPGRNAEAWEIFDEDERTAITWHRVCTQIDGGEIILQEEFDIPENITAINLLAMQNRMQIETFDKVFDLVNMYNFSVQKQQLYGKYPIHYAKDVPNDGELNLSWSISKMWAFLRAMDYGPLYILGNPFVVWNGKRYVWNTYEKQEGDRSKDDIVYSSDTLVISKGNSTIKLIGLEEVS